LLNIFLIWLLLAGFQMGLKMSWKFWSFNCIFSRIEHVKLSFNRRVLINSTHLLKKNMLTKSSICSTYCHANRMLMYIARNRLKVILLHDYKFFFHLHEEALSFNQYYSLHILCMASPWKTTSQPMLLPKVSLRLWSFKSKECFWFFFNFVTN
jgi:hypothetical protein